ncbi:unnamed protein product [Psylliodes chrysocephalus]|uniref:Reverse transcriptase domain-containing protein n=1 Tax=Psylliodes chrysocephalus TaxID=3402493 RepID=A0A9P0GMI1_9CUCU|nr:unnamed protein product [Psylliodes chrysocephala]
MYADDLKMFAEIWNFVDFTALQSCLAELLLWYTKNYLHLNPGKCSVMTYTRKKSYFTFDYQINGTVLSRPEFIKDLGVHFDRELTFARHIEQTVMCASRSLGFVIPNSKQFKSIHTMKLLYISFVRSRLEYASVV